MTRQTRVAGGRNYRGSGKGGKGARGVASKAPSMRGRAELAERGTRLLVLGVQLQRPGELLARLLRPPGLRQRDPVVGAEVGVARTEPHRLGKLAQGVREPLLV